MLQYVAVCCKVLCLAASVQCVAVRCSALQYVAVCCSMLCLVVRVLSSWMVTVIWGGYGQ